MTPIQTQAKHTAQAGKISLWLSIPLGLVALLLALYFLFANTLLKNVAQSAIGDAAGAEANIADVSHSLFPFGIEIKDLQVTDNASPHTNKVAADLISANIELMPLLSGKVIIDDLIAQNIAFGTLRNTAGEVYRASQQNQSFGFPALEDLPSVDEILASTPLKTAAAVTDAQKVVTKYQAPLKAQYETLPSKEKMAEFKTRIEAFKDMDFKNPAQIAKATSEFKQLKEEISEQKQKIATFIELANKAKAEASTSVNALKTAPQQDYELLQGLVAGDEAAIAQVTQRLFGEKAQLYTKVLVAAADMMLNAAPSTQQEEQTAVDNYPEYPNLWIKNADISVKWLNENLSSTWSDITDQHNKVGAPTIFNIASLNAQSWQAFTLNGRVEILDGLVTSSQTWDVQGAVLENLSLIPEDAKQKLSAVLNSGMLNSTGNLDIVANQLQGQSVFDLSNLDLIANGQNDLTHTIATIIGAQNAMQLKGVFSGDISRPSIAIKSDLDSSLLKSLGASLENNPKLLELKQKLNAKAAAQLGTSNQQLDAVNDLLAAAQGDTNTLTELLNAQLADKKEAVLDKLKNKFFNE